MDHSYVRSKFDFNFSICCKCWITLQLQSGSTSPVELTGRVNCEQALYYIEVVKTELSQRAKLSIYESINVATFWVVTHVDKLSFLPRMAGLRFKYKARSLDIRRELKVEPPLVFIDGLDI